MPTSTEIEALMGGRAISEIVFDAPGIARRVEELGREITVHYPEGDLLVLGLLKGSFIFLADLVRTIRRPHSVDFLVVSSYGEGTTSSGRVQLVYDPGTDLAGKHILVVEDIIDSGNTVNRLARVLLDRQPRSLEVCALLHKRLGAPLVVEPRFVGFDAPPDFLVGYGLDHAEAFRHLPFVASIKE